MPARQGRFDYRGNFPSSDATINGVSSVSGPAKLREAHKREQPGLSMLHRARYSGYSHQLRQNLR